MYIRGIHVPMCLGDEAYFVVSVCAMLISADLPPSLCPVVGLVTAFGAVRRLSTQMLSTPPSLLSIIIHFPIVQVRKQATVGILSMALIVTTHIVQVGN